MDIWKPSTRREGLSCGYLEIDIQEENGIVEKRQTCFLYDPKVASSKTLDEATRLNFNGLSKKAENDNINYQFTIFGYNGELGILMILKQGLSLKKRMTLIYLIILTFY